MENKNITILVIDDIQDNLISLKALIRESFSDALIFTALSGAKGIEIASEKDPDVILLDIVMPEMDGFEVCKRLKANSKLVDIPVVFVTALKGDKDSRIYALECGAEAFLAKPIEPSELTAQIRAMVKIKAAKVYKRDEKERLTFLVEEQTRELNAKHKATLNLLYSIRKENDARIKTEEALRESEENYKSLIDSGQALIWTAGLDKKCNYFNYHWLQFTGRTLEQEIGDGWVEGVHPDDLEFCFKTYVDAFDKRIPFSMDYRLKHNSGNYRWIQDNGSPRYDKKEQFIGYIGNCLDIDQQRNANEVIRENEERFRAVSEYSFNSICIVNIAGKIIWTNDAMLRMGKYSSEQIYGAESFASFIAPESLPFVLSNFMKFVNGDEYEHFYEFYFLRSNGEKRLAEKHMTHYKDRYGNVNLVISMLDITERKEMEVALHNSFMRYQMFFENTGSSNSIFDSKCCLILQNKESIAQFGISPEDAVGKSVYDLFGQKTGEVVYKRMKRVLETGIGESFDTHFNLETGNKWFRSTYQALHDEYNSRIGIQVISQDITQKKQIELLQILSANIIDILNSDKNSTEILTEILAEIKRVTNLSAMGIRFKRGEDFPYISTLGFSNEFIEKEKSLLIRNKKQNICRSIDGTAMLCCTCGMVISGKYNAVDSPLTTVGSFWTNNSYPLLNLTIDDEPRFNPRNTCIHSGYGSIAIIPIKAKDSVVGTLQLNEKRTNAFTLEMIHALESICQNIGNTLMRKEAEVALRNSEAQLKEAMKIAKLGAWELDIEKEEFTFYDTYIELLKAKPNLDDKLIISLKDYAQFFVEPIERERVKIETQKAIVTTDSNYVNKLESSIITTTGEKRNTEVTIRVQKDENGKTVKTFGVVQDITERIKSEALFKENNSRLELAMQVANMAWWEMDVITGNVKFEKRKAEMLGYSSDQFKHYTDFMALVHPEDYEKAMDAMRGHFDGRYSIYELEYRILCKSGEYKWFYDIGSIVKKDINGKPITVTGIVIDITDRKRSETAIQQSEEKFSKLFKSSPDAIMLVRLNDSIIIDANDVVCKLSGFSRDEFIGKSMLQVNFWVNLSDRNRYLDLLLKNQHVENFETEIRMKSGEIKIGLLSSELIPLDGEAYILAIIRDITDRKKAEDLLFETKEKFAKVFENAPVLISITDINTGEYIDVNEYACIISEFSKEEIIGKTATNLDWISKSSRNLLLDTLETNGRIQDLELSFKSKTGKEIIGIVNGQKIIIENKECLLTITVDITERKKLNEALKRSEAIQSKMVANIGDVIAIIDCNGINTYNSPNIEKWFGWKPEDLVGKNAFELVHPQDLDRIKLFFNSFIEIENTTDSIEFRYRCKTGEYTWIKFTGINLLHDAEINGILGNYHDITKRIKTQDLIVESETKFRLLYSSMSQGLALHEIIVDEDGKPIDYVFLEINDSYTSLLGVTREMAIGKRIKVVMPSVEQYWIDVFGKVALTGEPMEYENYLETTGKYYSTYSYSPKQNQFAVLVTDITERKHAEEALANQKYFFEQMFMQSSISTQILDAEGWCERINPKLTELFGVEPQHIEGKIYNIYKDESILKAGIDRYLNHSFKEGKPTEWEVFFDIGQAADSQNIQLKDRKIEWFYNWAYPIFNKTGKISNVIIQHQNITERKNLEEHFKKEHANLSAIIDNSKNGIWSVTNEFCLIRSNKAFNKFAKDIWGVELYEGINMLSFLPSEEIVEYNQLYSLVLTGENVSVIKIAMIENYNFYYEISFNPIKVDTVIIGVSCQLQDITQRIIDEQTILRRTQELRLLIDSSIDYIFSIDKVYRIVTCNKSFRGGVNAIIGRPPMVGESILFSELDGIYRTVWQDVFERVLDGESLNFESEPKWFNGKNIVLSSELNPIYDTQGDVIGIVGVVRDITQAKTLERRILNATIEAEERERNHFARELHEGLGPILSVIKLYFQWLNKPNIQTSKESLMENIQATIADAIATTKEISYKLSPHVLEHFGIENAVNNFIEKIRSNNTIHFTFDNTLKSRIEKDIEISIYRVITECINNSIKYANAKNITISLTHENNILYLSFSDDGIGFDTLKVKEQGMGLGLMNMQNRVTMLGGAFILKSSIGNGVSIFVEIPYKGIE